MADDLTGIGKVLPIDKLIKVVSKAFGRVYKSYFDKIDAESKAYEIKLLAQAKAEELKIIADAMNEASKGSINQINFNKDSFQISSQPELNKQTVDNVDLPLIQRTKNRLDFQEAKKQLNIEKVVAVASEQLKNEEPIENTDLDEDWVARFFNIVEDVSNEEMQFLWAKILAGEIKKTGTFSLRTIELLRNLSQNDANLLIKISKFKLKNGKTHLIYYKDLHDKFYSDWGVSYADYLSLIELGILNSNDASLAMMGESEKNEIWFVYGKNAVKFSGDKDGKRFSIKLTPFTRIGEELLGLIENETVEGYLQEFVSECRKKRTDFKVYLGIEGGMKDGVQGYIDFTEI